MSQESLEKHHTLECVDEKTYIVRCEKYATITFTMANPVTLEELKNNNYGLKFSSITAEFSPEIIKYLETRNNWPKHEFAGFGTISKAWGVRSTK